jgi:hypothetical protein
MITWLREWDSQAFTLWGWVNFTHERVSLKIENMFMPWTMIERVAVERQSPGLGELESFELDHQFGGDYSGWFFLEEKCSADGFSMTNIGNAKVENLLL